MEISPPHFMQAILERIIGELNGSVFILLGIFVITCHVLFKLGKWTQKFSDHDKRVEKIEGLSEKVVSLTTKIDLIYQVVNPHSPVRSMSPASLTEIGEKIVDDIDAESIFSKYAEKLTEEVAKMNPTNAYDIQKYSFEIAKSQLLDLLNENELNRIKKEAFTIGILVEDVLSVFGVLLRNCILKKKGIAVAEIDKCNPENTK